MSESAERRSRIVVKIGGSLLDSPRLDGLLTLLILAKNYQIVIVPGGGPFADAIRDAQKRLGFSNGLAHRLALDAMDHSAEILAEQEPALVPHCGSSELPSVWAGGQVPIWSPREVRSGHPDIEESWAVTSDSLAAWLASRIGADRLILVKSADAPHESPELLARSGVVDEAFPGFSSRFRGAIALARPGDEERFLEVLDGQHDIGRPA